MKKIKALLTLAALCLGIAASAQQITVSGTIKDNSNGDTVPYAGIQVKGTTTGSMADGNGKFSIKVQEGAILVFSAIGYESKEVVAKAGDNTIFLKVDSETLDASVVVGYGSTKKIGNAVGTVATVKGDLVKNAASQSALDLLQGQVAGMSVLSTGGVAGDNSISMRIHGVGSLSSGTEPLFIVDGVQSNSAAVMNMNPNDIQSISVLKDASSTSIYGAQGANGVVYVTTKGGHFDERASVSVHSQWGLTTLANRQFYENMMSGDQLKDFWIRSGVKTAEDIYKNYTSQGWVYNTKWHEYIQNLAGLQSQNDVTIEGGSKKVAYLISASQFHQDGATVGNYFDRYTLRTNVQARPVNWLKAGINFSGYIKKDQANDTWGSSQDSSADPRGGLSYTLNPLYSPIDPATGKVYEEYWPGVELSNPYYYMKKRPDTYETYGINGSVYLEIEPYKGLVISSRLGTNSYASKRTAGLLPSASFTDLSQKLIQDYLSFKNTITNTIEYSSSIKDHEFSVLVGQEGIGYKYRNHYSNAMGQTDDRLWNLQDGDSESDWEMGDNTTEYSFLSFFAHADYNYAGKYFIDGTFRYDASSRFGKNNRWAPFWAVGAMWKLNRENWLRDIKAINDLSLKVSYGTQGNADIGNYQHLGLVASSGNSTYDGHVFSYLAQPSNESLTWEKQKLFTVTLTGRFWDRLDAEIGVYNRVTSDMLLDVPQPYTTGFSSLVANVGSMKNTGIDITLGVDILKGKDYYLKFNTTFNYNAEKVTSLFDGRKSWEMPRYLLAYVVGQPVMFYTPIYAGVDPADGAPMWYLPGEDKNVCTMDPNRTTKTYNEEALTQNTGKRLHEPVAGGFGLRGYWKGLSINIDFAYYCGKNLVNNDAFFYANPNQFSSDNQNKIVSDFWTPENTGARFPAWNKGHQMQFDTHLLEDASFLRLKNLQIGYALQKKALGNQKVVKGVQFTFTGRNLLTATKYEGMDPEIDGNLTAGIPGNTLQVLGGVEITF